MKRYIPFILHQNILTFLVLSSCHPNSSEQTAEKLVAIENNGIHMEFADSQIGDTTLLFIHGWGINHGYWEEQVAHFSEPYRVVTLDLPGFGASGKNREDWSAQSYAGDVETLISKLDLKDVILIGHSMSGAIVVETALLYQERVIAVVGIDNLKDIDFIPTPEKLEQYAGVLPAIG